MLRNLSEVARRPVAEVCANLMSDDRNASASAGSKLVRDAKEFGLCLQDYLKLSALPQGPQGQERKFEGLNGFEATLAFLNLPFRDAFEQGVFLQAASDTFQKYPGTRAMFPEVVDQMLRWKNRQQNMENLAALIAQSRTINGTELISMAVEDDSQARGTFTIAEFGKIPVRTLRTSTQSVGIFKHGSGIKTSYEFERRASLDILTPFAARVARELEISKVRAATQMLINGDGVNGAAPVIGITDASIGGVVHTTKKLRTQYDALAKWLMLRAAAGTPVDTIVGNIDVYIELLMMFTPTLSGETSEIEAAVRNGAPGLNLNLPLMGGNATFALSTSMPAGQLLGMTKGETLEELVEAGSSISENERSIENQSVVYVRTENTGFKLAFSDTRQILDMNA